MPSSRLGKQFLCACGIFFLKFSAIVGWDPDLRVQLLAGGREDGTAGGVGCFERKLLRLLSGAERNRGGNF